MGRGMAVMGARLAGELAHHGEAARALEGGEVVAAGQFGDLGDGVGLEEIAPGLGGLDGAHDTQDGDGDVVKADALAGDVGGFEDGPEGREQGVGEEPADLGRRAWVGRIVRQGCGNLAMAFRGV